MFMCVCESVGDRRVCLCAHASNLPRVRQCAYYARTLPPYSVCVCESGGDRRVCLCAHASDLPRVCVCVSVLIMLGHSLFILCVCV